LKTRTATPRDGLDEALSLLAAGEPVALPTETVYGLAADALNPAACAKIFEAKDRPLSDPLIVHLPSADWLPRIARPTPLADALAEKFWPGPLTLVLPRNPEVPDIVTAGQETVAVRQSAHPDFALVASRFGRPLAAPSANRFGRISPTTAAHVEAELGGRIPLILDGGPCSHGIESTIVLVRPGSLQILREGPVTTSDLAAFAPVESASAVGIATPGSLKSHYAPRTPLTIEQNPLPLGPRDGLLAWSQNPPGFLKTEFLSPSLDLREAAANLYGAMRRLDEAGLDRIVAEPVPSTGIGAAIMERLRKASAK
jgi:L-threonylcarbamoyladenylate synthase